MLLFGGCVSHAQRMQRELEWAQSVLLGAEMGDARTGVVRWVQPIHFLVVAAPGSVQVAVECAVGELRAALGDIRDLEVEYVGERDPRIGRDGYITVFATAPQQAGALAKEHGAQQPALPADGWFTILWNGQFELTRGLVFLDPALDSARLQHTVLEEMFQALGPCNDSGRIQDSLVYERGFDAGKRTSLGRVDRLLLALLYRDLSPGDDARAIERAVRRAW